MRTLSLFSLVVIFSLLSDPALAQSAAWSKEGVDLIERLTVIRVFMERFCVKHELTSGATMVGGGDRDFAPEFIRHTRFAFADTFGFRSMP